MESIELAKKIAKPFEGFFSKVYKCPAGFWTIAWGHRCNEKQPPVTIEDGEIFLNKDMVIALNGVIKHCPILLSYPKKLAAITDFCFNLGVGRLQISTLKRCINKKDWNGAINQLNKWVYGGGRKLNGLVKRRMIESIIFKGE